MNDRHTGLGGSLLLQRTEAMPAASDPEQISQPTALPPAPLPPREPLPPAPKKPPRPLRDRCTLYLESDLNRQLELAARIETRQRSDVVNDILRKHLPTYRIDREGE